MTPVPLNAALRATRLTRELRALVLAGLIALVACAPPTPPSQGRPDRTQWHEFQGTWTAAGTRHMIHFGGERRCSIGTLNGSLLLSGPTRPNVGFRAEAIVLNDTATGMIGRAVWTDEHGDEIYSELRGSGTAAANKIVGTFVGGTGTYAGATGSYEFSWRFMLQAEDGTVQGQSIGLNGRVRAGLEGTRP